jgi:DNA-binding NtrC family response regulator
VVAGYAANDLARLRRCRTLEAENSRLRGPGPAAERLVGRGPAMQQLEQIINRFARCRSTVLIHGETGSGKELVALALHRHSPRRNGPLVVANCGAIAPTLLESELFGHCEGAFTGATASRPGLFQQADDGTLFLDEIGDMSLDCQVKVLRVLEGKGFRPVGGTEEVKTDVRLIAATHKDLAREVKAGRFRQDLYFRLRVLFVQVPPLREHREDIPDLVEHFLDKFALESGRRKRLSAEALQRLQEYPWPGNVRELRTVIESAVMMSDGEGIEPHELWLQDAPITADQPLSLNLEHVEAWAIRQAMQKTKGNVTRAAKVLGIARETLGLKLKKYQIAREEWGEQRADGSA